MRGEETRRGCRRDQTPAPITQLNEPSPPMVTWLHRGGFSYLPPYEGPPCA